MIGQGKQILKNIEILKDRNTNITTRQWYDCLGFPGDSAVKNLPAKQEMWETQVQSLDFEDPLEKEMATHYNILAGKLTDRGVWWTTVHGVEKELDTI